MKKPEFLKEGDKVAIVSTARKVSKTELEYAENILKSWGLNVIYGNTVEAEENQFAGSDIVRAKDFQVMMDSPEVKAIWCARGGYGTVRMIDQLDFSLFAQNPKWVVGYSDITVLHSELHNLGVMSLHAQMPVQLEEKSAESAESIRKVLFGEEYEVQFKNDSSLNRAGQATGSLIGGNLSVLYSLCGSFSAIKTAGKILFIEDLDEYVYHIDRMMMNLKRNGMLSELRALLIGGMSDMHDNAIPFGKTAEEIIFDAVKEYDYPVYFGVPAGHIPDNRALIFGEKVVLKPKEDTVVMHFLNKT